MIANSRHLASAKAVQIIVWTSFQLPSRTMLHSQGSKIGMYLLEIRDQA